MTVKSTPYWFTFGKIASTREAVGEALLGHQLLGLLEIVGDRRQAFAVPGKPFGIGEACRLPAPPTVSSIMPS